MTKNPLDELLVENGEASFYEAHPQTNHCRKDHQRNHMDEMVGDHGEYSMRTNNCKHTSREFAYGNKKDKNKNKNKGERSSRLGFW